MVSPIIYSNMATSAHKQADSFPPIAEVKGRNIFTYWEGRRKWNANHGMEKLWRVHDGLYDLSGFNHPGGKSWLDLTKVSGDRFRGASVPKRGSSSPFSSPVGNKGTDVTELFESHHLDIEKARAVLAKYYVRVRQCYDLACNCTDPLEKDADWPRESPLTFEPDGFYSILRDRVFKKVKEVGKMPPVLSKLITDGTAIAYLGLLAAATYRRSLPLAVLAGCAQGALAVAAHNFGHRNNWRKHYMDLAGRAHRFWRTHHEVSHHMFPNSSLDIEVPGGEAAMGVSFFIDGPRSNRSRAWGLLRMLTNFVAAQIKPTILAPFFSGFKVEQLNYILLLLMIALRRRSPQPHSRSLRGALETIGIWSLGRGISTLWLWFTGTLAGHYSDDAWRQGETAPDLKDIKDFGLFQIETCGDRIESYSVS